MNIAYLLKCGYKFLLNKNEYRTMILQNFGFYRNESDEDYLKKRYLATIGVELNLSSPRTFNEKMQWIKLYDRKPIYTKMVDKYEAKKIVAEKIGEEYIVKTYGVYDSFDEIDFDRLPNKFVLKCTHDSGGIVVVKDKKMFNKKAAKRRINSFLKKNYYYLGREWPYKDVPPRIIVEEYLEDSTGCGELSDYKIHCFEGQPQIIQIITNRYDPHGMINDHYDLDWNKFELTRGHYVSSPTAALDKPKEIDKMLQLASILATGLKYIRVDFYISNHKILFGELTFFPASGFNPFHPEKWDEIFGEWLKLPIDEQ